MSQHQSSVDGSRAIPSSGGGDVRGGTSNPAVEVSPEPPASPIGARPEFITSRDVATTPAGIRAELDSIEALAAEERRHRRIGWVFCALTVSATTATYSLASEMLPQSWVVGVTVLAGGFFSLGFIASHRRPVKQDADLGAAISLCTRDPLVMGLADRLCRCWDILEKGETQYSAFQSSLYEFVRDCGERLLRTEDSPSRRALSFLLLEGARSLQPELRLHALLLLGRQLFEQSYPVCLAVEQQFVSQVIALSSDLGPAQLSKLIPLLAVYLGNEPHLKRNSPEAKRLAALVAILYEGPRTADLEPFPIREWAARLAD